MPVPLICSTLGIATLRLPTWMLNLPAR